MMRRVAVLAWFSMSSLALAAVPDRFSVQGVLRDDMGKLQSMMVNVSVKLWDAQMTGSLLAGPYTATVPANNGLFTVAVDDPALRTKLGSAAQVWLEVAVGNDTFARQLVTPQIFAVMCGTADVANSMPGVTDLNGNIGIGTATPREPLQLGSSTALAPSLFGSSGATLKYATVESSPGVNIGVEAGARPEAIKLDTTGIHFYQAPLVVDAGDPAYLDEVMRISSAGRLGIGLPDAGVQRLLHVSSNSLGADRTVARFENRADAGSNFMYTGIELLAPGLTTYLTQYGPLYTASSGAHGGYSALEASATGRGVELNALAPTGRIRFNTGGAFDQMLIHENGNVGIGTTTPTGKLTIAGGGILFEDQGLGAAGIDWRVPGQTNPFAELAVGGGGGLVAFRLYTRATVGTDVAATEVFRINPNGYVGILTNGPGYPLDVVGTVRATAFMPPSDARLKKDVRTLDRALDDVKRLRGVRYTMKKDGKPSIGVIAQELEQVYPELVSTDAEGIKSVDYMKLTAALIESTKTLAAENAALRKRLERIEAKLSARP